MITLNSIVEYLNNEGYCAKQQHHNGEIMVVGYSQLHNPRNETITWLKKGKKLSADMFRAVERLERLVIITSEAQDNLPPGIDVIICTNPKAAFFSVVRHFFVVEREHKISASAVIETEIIGNNVGVGHFTYIGPEVEIGDDVVIGNNVSIECPCKIGAHTRIGSGTVIGNDGFGFYKDSDGVQQRVPHTGGVVIGEHVEIDANVCIDRGTIGDTIVGDYVKIDNFVQIAHNDNIQSHSMVLGHAAIAGSVVLGDHSYVAPGALVMNQKRVGARSLVGMGAVVVRNVPEGKVVAGNPAFILWDND